MTLLLELLHEQVLLIDFGMFLLIWLVQLIVYPSLREISDAVFREWHHAYCRRISFFVLPLMILQILESASSCFFVGGLLDWIRLGALFPAWLVTFVHSAPTHGKLSETGKDLRLIDDLIRVNWLRTILWSGVFSISCLNF